jgi:hypothetical protein
MKTTIRINNFRKKKIKHRVKLPKRKPSDELLHKDPQAHGRGAHETPGTV